MSNYNIVPPHLAVKAMRDNGYKNAAYAIAELMDNAIQSGATQVELLCGEEQVQLDFRSRSRIKKIAVLDNGSGMDETVLRMALQFGNGTYLDPDKHTGIGRFGMGLPSSSISQARRVDVWTWQDGIENAIHSYIDLDEIEAGKIVNVPEAKASKVPDIWCRMGNTFEKTGTIVVWSEIDRCMWRTGKTIIKNSELLIGRIYRRFLANKKVTIRLAAFNLNQLVSIEETNALPNDPLYLMSNTSCPQPANIPHGQSIFEPWGEEMTFDVKFREQSHQVTVRFSIATEEARAGHNPGEKPHGKHAKNNLGVSLIRADRELDLDSAWTDPHDPRERWWGAEVEFPPSLDEIFGVTNNKQSARYFSDLAKVGIDSLLEEGQSLSEIKNVLSEDEDPRLPLLEIAHHIDKNIKTMRRLLRAQTAGMRSSKRHQTDNIPEAKATEATQKRKDEGHIGTSDAQEKKPPEERQTEIKNELVEQGITDQTAEELAASTIAHGYKFTFANANLDSPAFFDVKSRGGSLIVSLNTNHPAYEQLLEALENDVDNVKEEELKLRLNKAGNGLKLLLTAWARYEDEQPMGRRRDQVRDARWDWGRMARDFLDGEE